MIIFDTEIKMKDEITKERINYIDIYKGIGIILMVMGHVGFGVRFDKFIHGFHMPMFFFVSGFLTKSIENIDTKKYLLRKIKTLLIPYIFFGVFHYIFWEIAIDKFNGNFTPLKTLFWINTDNNMPIAGALWFLTALFFVDIIYLFMEKIIKNRIIIIVLVCLLFCFGIFEIKILNFRLPFAIDSAFVGLGLFYIGQILRKNQNKKFILLILNLKDPLVILISLIVYLSIIFNHYVNMRTGSYSFIPFFLINSVVASCMLINISKFIEKKFKSSIFLYLQKYFIYIGKNSMIFLCLNQIVILCLKYIIRIPNYYITKVIILFATFLILTLVSYVIENSKLKVILGKF